MKARRGAGARSWHLCDQNLGDPNAKKRVVCPQGSHLYGWSRGVFFLLVLFFHFFNYVFTMNTSYFNDLGGKLQFVRGKFGGLGITDSPALRELRCWGSAPPSSDLPHRPCPKTCPPSPRSFLDQRGSSAIPF